MPPLLSLVVVHLAYFGSGCWLALCLDGPFLRASALVRWPLLYFAGAFVQIMAMHVPLVLGRGVAATAELGIYGGLGGLVALIVISKRNGVLRFRSELERTSITVALLMFAALAPAVLFLWARLTSLPDVEFDSTAFWFLKTRLFLAGDTFWSESFQNIYRIHAHQNYPVYLPLLALQQVRFTGVVDDWIYKPGIAIYYSMGLALLFGLIKERLNARWSLLGMGILLYTPAFCYGDVQGSAYSAYADFPLGLMIASAVGTALLALERPSAGAFLPSAVFVASAVLMKTEGTIFATLFLPATAGLYLGCCSGRCGGVQRFRPLLPILAASGLLMAWVALRSRLPDDSPVKIASWESLRAAYRNAPLLVRSALHHLATWRLWGVLPLLFPVLLATALVQRPSRWPQRVYLATVASYFVVVVALFLFLDPSAQHVEFLMAFTFDRIVIQAIPALLLLALMENPWLKASRLDVLSPNACSRALRVP